MKKNYFSNSLKLIFILFLLLSCSDSYEQNEEDITPTPALQTNTLYTSMQWETSSPAEEANASNAIESAPPETAQLTGPSGKEQRSSRG